MNDKQDKTKMPSWSFVAFRVLSVVIGVMMIMEGVTVYKKEAMISATMKSGPMTGLQSVITGVIAAGAGSLFIAFEALNALKTKRKSNKVARSDQ